MGPEKKEIELQIRRHNAEIKDAKYTGALR